MASEPSPESSDVDQVMAARAAAAEEYYGPLYAVLAAKHPRLGADSPLRRLPSYVLHYVWTYLSVVQRRGPNTYVFLPRRNVSSYKIPRRGGWAPEDSDVTSVWAAIRVEPSTLVVNTHDTTYCTSTGVCHHHSNATSYVPFGTAFGCEAPHTADAHAVIDLRGTPFVVEDTFGHAGYLSKGEYSVSCGGQVVQLSGGGHCGWIAPSAALAKGEAVVAEGGAFLQLGHVTTGVPARDEPSPDAAATSKAKPKDGSGGGSGSAADTKTKLNSKR